VRPPLPNKFQPLAAKEPGRERQPMDQKRPLKLTIVAGKNVVWQFDQFFRNPENRVSTIHSVANG